MLANESGQVMDRWTYDAWGETTSRTGVTENDYQYAGERFDRTTELYQLQARYMDPKTGTFLSLDPHQGNRQDPLSLHKYLYANANPVNNTDPTGMFSFGGMLGGLAGHGILSTAGGLNFLTALRMLQKAGYGIQFLCAMRSLVVAMMTEDSEQFLLALSNGIVSVAGMIGICETHVVIQTLTKALAGESVKKNFEAFLEARANNDVAVMLVAGLNIAMDLAAIF